MSTVLNEFIQRYGHTAGAEGPVRLVQEVFGVEPDGWQADHVLRPFGAGEQGISVRSCHGVGKTAVAAWLVWVMLLTRFPQKTVATAPGAPQLEGALIPEIKMWGKKLPPLLLDLYELKAKGIYLRSAPESSYFEARTSRSDNPEALQGVHSDNVLLICDEASGIPEAVYEAAIGSMSGHNATTLLIGNPVRTSGMFFDTHNKAGVKEMWHTFKVGHMDSDRVTDDFVERVRRQYGERSNAFRVRALGEFPLTDDDTVISWESVELAREREVQDSPNAQRVWGLDVARFGSDSCALAERTKRKGQILDVWEGMDLMATCGKVKVRWDETPESLRPFVILIDVIGMGGGVVDRLQELGLPVRGVNVGETAAMNERFDRARSELWWMCRDWLNANDVQLAKDDDRDGFNERLARELVVPKYKPTSSGRILVEPKSATKKVLGSSPDVADSFVLTFAEDLAILTGGGFGNWSEPIKRGTKIP